MFVLKLCEKNSSVKIRFKIFVMAFRARKLFEIIEKQAPGRLRVVSNFGDSGEIHARARVYSPESPKLKTTRSLPSWGQSCPAVCCRKVVVMMRYGSVATQLRHKYKGRTT